MRSKERISDAAENAWGGVASSPKEGVEKNRTARSH